MAKDRTIDGSARSDVLNGGKGDDEINGKGGNDVLISKGGNDTLDGGAGGDYMEGGRGNDIYYVNHANDRIVERVGEGMDTVYTTIDYRLTNFVENLTLLGFDAIDGYGNNEHNQIIGNNGDNTLWGGGGSDTLVGKQGNDTFIQSSNNGGDRIQGNEGYDTVDYSADRNIRFFTFSGNIKHGDFTDNLQTVEYVIASTSGQLDVIDATEETGTLIINLSGPDSLGSISGLTSGVIAVKNFEYIFCGSGNNFVQGSAAKNLINAGDKADVLRGGDGDDYLHAYGGDDQLWGDGGNDILNGGAGNDSYYFADNWGHDTLTDDALNSNKIYMTDVTSDLVVNLATENNRDVKDSNGNWIDLTRNSIEYFFSGSGNDLITGGAAEETLLGGDGNDTLNGGGGNDQLNGELGNDVLYGGVGIDKYVFYSPTFDHDIINDVAGNGDSIDLTRFSLSEVVTFAAVNTNTTDSNVDALSITIVGNNSILIQNYFDNTAGTASGSHAGAGLIELINLSGGVTLRFEDIQGLA